MTTGEKPILPYSNRAVGARPGSSLAAYWGGFFTTLAVVMAAVVTNDWMAPSRRHGPMALSTALGALFWGAILGAVAVFILFTCITWWQVVQPALRTRGWPILCASGIGHVLTCVALMRVPEHALPISMGWVLLVWFLVYPMLATLWIGTCRAP
jgi:hypothetical protein